MLVGPTAGAPPVARIIAGSIHTATVMCGIARVFAATGQRLHGLPPATPHGPASCGFRRDLPALVQDPRRDQSGDPNPVGGVGQQRAVAFDLADHPGRRQRRHECAPAPTPNGTAVPGGRPRRLSRRPFRAVAPAITGSATCRDSRLASSRVNRRSRAAASVAPLREIPGTSAAGLRHPEPQRVGGARLLVTALLRAAVRQPHRDRAHHQRRRDRRRRAEAGLDLALQRVADDRRRSERQRDQRQAAHVESAHRLLDLAAQRDQQRGGGAGVERDFE